MFPAALLKLIVTSTESVGLGRGIAMALLGTLIPNVASLTAAVHLPAGVIAIVIA